MRTTPAATSRTLSFSVRQRLTATVALVTTAALLVVGLALWVLESRRLDRAIDDGLTQEVGELRQLQRDVDPRTGRPFSDPNRLLEVFLSRNLPDPDETLWAFPSSGRDTYVGEPPGDLRSSAAFPELVEQLSTTGGVRSITVAGRAYRIAVQPVDQGRRTAAFVVTHDVGASRAPLRRLMTTYTLLSALCVLLVAATSSWIAGRLLRPVTRLRATAQSITEGDLNRRIEVTGHDDLTELQSTFNDMLDRLEAAFATQRHLLDDAAHELRTPLTVLRGHLEVVDAGDRDDVEATRELLLDEIDRMARLVSDLLLLAKAERPDFVRPTRVNVEGLVAGILERARVLGVRSWVLDASAPTVARLDPQRITQAMLQLADNAVHHTHEGAEIGMGSRLRGDAVELWIRDTGTGVPEELSESIFGRFVQGANSAGFGLGLSIVTAIVQAHGGRIVLDRRGDAEVPGATFRIIVPLGGPS